MNFNYNKICQDLLKTLPQRQREVISRRFALKNQAPDEGRAERETLESIGKSFNITRERDRQIEENGLEEIKSKIGEYRKVFQCFGKYLNKFGGIRKEAILLEELGDKKAQPEIYFLLTINEDFKRFSETDEFHSLCLIDENSLSLTKKIIDAIFSKLKEIRKPLSLKELKDLNRSYPVSGTAFLSFLEVSKKIQKNKEDLFGLKDWPEINPKGIKDRAYLVFKKIEKPLHFAEVANLIEGSQIQTVHNELIRDSRFVLVGRGIYALTEWGYYSGQVKDVISKVLKETGKPLTKEEVLERVLKQRLVKENTILLNLSNKNYFLRDPQGRYMVKEI